jgi:transposase
MCKLNLTIDEKKQLRNIHKYTYNNSMRENRIRVVLAYDENMSYKDIKKILLLDLQTIRRYINDFKEYRMDSIDFEDGRKSKSGNSSKLNEEQIIKVKEYLHNNIVSEAKEIQEYIKTTFNIKYSLSGTTTLLHQLGFVYKKVITIPQKANTPQSIAKQLCFEKDYQGLKEQLEEEDTIYFLDGVHPTHNAKMGFAWIEKGEEKIIETNSGRSRVNLNGAYNVANGDIISLTSDTINSDSTLALFDIMLESNKMTKGLLYCISDNARYYKSYIIQEALKTEKYKRIKMIFIPPYSPNLNPIERVWKFFKKEVIENQFYKTFKEFQKAIDNFFNKEIKSQTMKEKLKRFASDNFHIRYRETLCVIGEAVRFNCNHFGKDKKELCDVRI